MRLPPLFSRENSPAARREREAQLERRLTNGLRRLSEVLRLMADRIEARRLERRGFETQERFLERTDKRD